MWLCFHEPSQHNLLRTLGHQILCPKIVKWIWEGRYFPLLSLLPDPSIPQEIGPLWSHGDKLEKTENETVACRYLEDFTNLVSFTGAAVRMLQVQYKGALNFYKLYGGEHLSALQYLYFFPITGTTHTPFKQHLLFV